MSNDKLAAVFMIFMASIFARASLATNITYDSTSVTPPSTTARLECTQYTMNGQLVTNTLTDNSPAFDPTRCVFLGGYPDVLFAGMIGGGSVGVSCPADYPYLQGRNQGWGLWAGSGMAGTDATCCALPDYTVSAASSWITPATPGVCP